MKRVAVIGGGLGGLVASGALAKEGVEVVLFEAGPTLGGKARSLRREGFTLDLGPTLLALPHMVKEAFDALGALDLLPRFFELERQCAYLFADGRSFDAFRDVERTAESAAVIDARERDGVLRFYRAAAEIWRAAGEPYLDAPLGSLAGYFRRAMRCGPSALWRGSPMGTLADLARRSFSTEALRAFAGRFATYAGASPFQASAAFAQIAHVERVYGVHHVEGGMGALAEALASAVRRLGVDVRLEQPSGWKHLPDGFAAGPRGGEEHFDAVISNVDPLEALGRSREPVALSGYVLLLDSPRLNLPHHNIVFGRDYRREFDEVFQGAPPSDPTVHICHPAATEPGIAPEGRSGVYVMANAPALPADFDLGREWPHSHEMRARCLAKLDALAPGTSPHVRVLGERTPVDLAREGAPRGSIYGFLPHGMFGPFRRPRNQGPQPGLFFAGGGTHPGGGVPLVMRSGLFAARLALEHLGGAR